MAPTDTLAAQTRHKLAIKGYPRRCRSLFRLVNLAAGTRPLVALSYSVVLLLVMGRFVPPRRARSFSNYSPRVGACPNGFSRGCLSKDWVQFPTSLSLEFKRDDAPARFLRRGFPYLDS